ncbi:CRISPR-associated endonuclease Cas2 [Thermostichus vulcanus]|uniref:CRISPR-associated endoribonuclease Cas2 n=1 Tax=Thermostichus vulcanus str. 'Rupite' TaxID=2813851 RepID=A0ABT0C9N9_THEVL|nr:CRISPR-associated endonuclease Cas2 [Thermostichus vulcanus]MCJ2542414.1 CRISPR-associated endonuclease Cas2 [Thermostichus vulcanus str. 'Rupite']
MLWLVCYDVVDDKRRQKLAKRLEQYCQRVQYSVFECPLQTADLEGKLERLWLPLLNLEEDSLRAYPLDATAKERTKVFGGPPPYEPPDYVIF